jgi:ABC-type Na+ efflux pump permease subunit
VIRFWMLTGRHTGISVGIVGLFLLGVVAALWLALLAIIFMVVLLIAAVLTRVGDICERRSPPQAGPPQH